MTISFARHQFPPAIIRRAVWLYARFTLSYRDVEDLLAERWLDVSYETVRRWVSKFGPISAARLRKRRPKPHSICHRSPLARRRRRGRGSGCAGPIQAQQARRVGTDAQASEEIRLRCLCTVQRWTAMSGHSAAESDGAALHLHIEVGLLHSRQLSRVAAP
jgi:hypothetical protein